MIIGAQKCGTSTLFSILNTHPSLVGCSTKEPDYFSKVDDWKTHLPHYEKLFERRDNVMYFEGSTTYTCYPSFKLNIWDDLYEYNPKLKFIYIVRNPVDRIISSYMHVYERGYTDLSLENAICQDAFQIATTRYYTQILPFIERFGRDRVLILEFDDLTRDTSELVRRTAEFLGVDGSQFGQYDSIHANASLTQKRKHHKHTNPPWHLKVVKRVAPPLWEKLTDNSDRAFDEKPVLEAEYREVIVRLLKSDIEALEDLIGKDLSPWYEGITTTSNV
jgi:hypothetical protein